MHVVERRWVIGYLVVVMLWWVVVVVMSVGGGGRGGAVELPFREGVTLSDDNGPTLCPASVTRIFVH